MTAYLWAAIGILAGFGMTALGDMASEEIRDRLDHLPHAILRLAARRLTISQRITVYQDEWLPELTYILKGAEARPITRLISGTSYALGILISVDRIGRHIHRAPRFEPPPPSSTGKSSGSEAQHRTGGGSWPRPRRRQVGPVVVVDNAPAPRASETVSNAPVPRESKSDDNPWL
jgi:hypothetical protein